VFLHPGDEVAISVTGLGTLANKIASPSEENPTLQRYAQKSSLPIFNTKTGDGHGLTALPNGKKLFYRKVGKEGGGKHIILIHGLGGSSEFYTPLISLLNLSNSYTLHLLDLEGHGLSPTSAASVISLQSYADDIQALVAPHISQGEEVSLIAHSMGCLVALTLILSSSFPVHSLALLGPPPTPLPAPGRAGMAARAALLRSSGLGPAAVVDAIIAGGTSSLTKEKKPLAVAAVRMSVLAMDAEGYAKGCEALGSHSAIDLDAVKRKLAGGKVLVVTGSEDGVSPPKIAEAHGRALGAEVKVLEGVGHWHVFEDGEGVAGAVGGFLGK
jgi:pimeloyl-ACP methyl ester carboxylesterase